MNNKSTIGQIGEDLACEYLRDKRYKILKRNYRAKLGEIDIVARDFNGTLVFAEVKTLQDHPNSARGLVSEDNLTQAKLVKFKRICELFVGRYPELILEKSGWRMDLLAINLITGDKPSIRYYENIS